MKQKQAQTLARSNNPLREVKFQLRVLNGNMLGQPNIDRFKDVLFKTKGQDQLLATKPQVLQINLGKLCNQICKHCHVDAGPDRKSENMNLQTVQQCLNFAIKNKIKVLDLTGGAPEMNPHFCYLVAAASKAGIQVQVRSNLTILVAGKKYADLPQFFKKHKVHVISSLPHYSQVRTDNQRGAGVYEQSIVALKKLNALGYGHAATGLLLDLVYNPSGAFLPDSQRSLERDFKEKLMHRHQVQFNKLITITNLPISRFLEFLIASGNYASYMQKLVDAYNPKTVDGLMCRETISVSWDGFIYDCDFNQMLDLKSYGRPHISELKFEALEHRPIVLGQHCFGCTAGAGSSCSGQIAVDKK